MKPKYAFTARAFYNAIKEYGPDIFKLDDKLYVVERTLINLPEFRLITVDNRQVDYKNIYLTPELIAGYIYNNWFHIDSPPPWGLNEEKDELMILAKFQNIHPDNIIVVFNDLKELSYLNRVYSNDELMTIADLKTHLR